MNENQVKELLKKQEERYKKMYDSFEIYDTVEFYPESGSHYETNEDGLLEGKIVDKSYGLYGCDLRVNIDGSGTELWISAEDVV